MAAVPDTDEKYDGFNDTIRVSYFVNELYLIFENCDKKKKKIRHKFSVFKVDERGWISECFVSLVKW